jgi:SAM-dependent methyltransferase
MRHGSKASDCGSEVRRDESMQVEVNRAVYESRRVFKHYLSDLLTPSETACLRKYQSHIAGRDVLDIGVGAGRTTHHLAHLARRYEAVDYSAVMVRYASQAMPGLSIRQADFRDLRIFDDCSFDFVFAPNNVIDALSHEGRMQALGEAYRVLRPSGLLAFSSHNINYKNAFVSPQLKWSSNPARLAINFARYLFSWRNYLRLKSLRQITPEYAILNDAGHYYACLHYYVARSEVNSQLARVGLRLNEAFDWHGDVIAECRDDSENPSLLYIAERSSD